MADISYYKHNRLVEGLMAGYMMATACVFHFTDALHYEVYNTMTSLFSPVVWSYILAVVSLGHIIALWLNGTNTKLSSPIRTITCLCHILVLGLIGFSFFNAGAYWPVLTMTFLGTLLVKPLLVSICTFIDFVKIRRLA